MNLGLRRGMQSIMSENLDTHISRGGLLDYMIYWVRIIVLNLICQRNISLAKNVTTFISHFDLGDKIPLLCLRGCMWRLKPPIRRTSYGV